MGIDYFYENGFFVKSTFKHFYELCYSDYFDDCTHPDKSSTMIDLLMCSGAKITYEMYNEIIRKRKKTQIDLKLLDCCELLHGPQTLWNHSLERKKLLIKKLQDT